MKSILTRSLLAVAALFVSLHSIGCNTIEGAGKDTEKVGEKIQDVADDAKN